MGQPRVIVVGAGPAGTRCAEALVAAGIRPTLIDEGRRNGGQIYRRQPENFVRSYATLYGTEAVAAEALHRDFDALAQKIEYLPETLIWNIAAGNVHAVREGREITLPFDALILCTGATDRIMPIKGWQFVGAFSLGGAQVALKSQACAIGRRVVFTGSGALLYLVASQYAKAGAGVAAVVDTSPWSLRLSALPGLLAQPSVLWKGVKLDLALRFAGVPIYHGATPLEIEGTPDAGVRALRFRDTNRRTHRVDCDAVAMGHHLRSETQLADIAHCAFEFDARTRQWLVKIDDDGRASVSGIYLAGDGARIRGARAAELSGRLAALAALQDLGHAASPNEMRDARQSLARWSRFAQGLSAAFPWPHDHAAQLPDDAIVCRCEAVKAGELRGAVHEKGAQEANRAKAFSRVGMGRCQGRYCGQAAAEIIAAAANIPVETVGRLRSQAPVKPLPVNIAGEAE